MNATLARSPLRFALAASLASLVLATLAPPAAAAGKVAGESLVVFKDVAIRGVSGSKVKLAQADGSEAVVVDGASAAIDFPKPPASASGTTALSSCSFEVRARDDGAHRLRLGFGDLGVVNLTEGDDAAFILPVFPGAAWYSARIYEGGKLVTTLTGQSKTLTVDGFDSVHDGKVDAVTFALAFAQERKDAWSMSLTHGGKTIVLTPEGSSATLADSPSEISVQTTAVTGGFVLVREAIAVRAL
ncbi:MAG: hypothetical protein NVS3B10_26310 [Polyangiales bacterium]